MESVILTTVIDTHKEREVVTVDIPKALIQTENPNSGISNRYYENKRQTVTYPSGDRSRIFGTLYYKQKRKSSAIPVIIKIIIWNANCIITIITKIEEEYGSHFKKSKST